MKGFSFGGKWWHYLVHVTVKGGPLFFLGLFLFVFYLTGRLLRHIGVFGSLFFVCRCAFFLCFAARRRFFFSLSFGVGPVGFAWFKREKNLF